MKLARGRLGWAGLLAVGWAGAGWWVWPGRGRQPPDVALADVDPAVREVVRKATAEVREQPGSAPAWGRLGMVLRAHDFDDAANVCFVEAARLDAAEPRW